MRKISDAGTYSHNGKNVPIAFHGKSDQHNATRKVREGRYVDTNQGSGMEDLYAIMAKYNIKGFEFGNWVTQEERAEYVSSLTPTLEDLFSVLGSRNIGINRNVGVAFGARGSRGALAHYEPVLNMINLTRYKGAGSLAHEYGHALDYNLGSFLDQHKDYPALSGGRSVAASLPENTGGQLRAYVNQIVDSIRNGKNFAKMELANKEAAAQGQDPVYSAYWFRRTEIFARFFEQYVCYCLAERQISSRLLVKRWSYYMSFPVYVDKDDFMKVKPVADKLMKEFAKFLNSAKGQRVRATAYPKPVIVKPKPVIKKLDSTKKAKPQTAAPKRKAATKTTKNEDDGIRHYFIVRSTNGNRSVVNIEHIMFSDNFHAEAEPKLDRSIDVVYQTPSGEVFPKSETKAHLNLLISMDKKRYKDAVKSGKDADLGNPPYCFLDYGNAVRWARKYYITKGGGYKLLIFSNGQVSQILNMVNGKANPEQKPKTTAKSKKKEPKQVEMKLTPRHFWTVWFDGDTVRVRKTIFSDHYHIAGHAKGLPFEKVECYCHNESGQNYPVTSSDYWLRTHVKKDKEYYKAAVKRGEYSTYGDVIKKVEGRDWYFRDINDAERFAKKHLPEGGKYLEYDVSEENWRHMLDIISGRIKIK